MSFRKQDVFDEMTSIYQIEIMSPNKEDIIKLLDDVQKSYIYHHIDVVFLNNTYKISFKEHYSDLWQDYPYWKLPDDLTLLAYNEEYIDMLTNEGKYTISNSHIDAWARIYQYDLTGKLEVDLLSIYKRHMNVFRPRDDQSKSDEALSQCLVDSYIKAFPKDQKGRNLEELNMRDLRYMCRW